MDEVVLGVVGSLLVEFDPGDIATVQLTKSPKKAETAKIDFFIYLPPTSIKIIAFLLE